MNTFGLFVACVLLLWAATLWGLHVEFRAQRYRDRNKPEACRRPATDEDYVAFWRDGAAGRPDAGRGYAGPDQAGNELAGDSCGGSQSARRSPTRT
jgi:hypothetical protein